MLAGEQPAVWGHVPGAEAILVKLGSSSSSSSGSRLRLLQSKHWFGNRVLRAGALLRPWSLAAVGRQDHQLPAPALGSQGEDSLPERKGTQSDTCLLLPLAADTQGLCQDGGSGWKPVPLENS